MEHGISKGGENTTERIGSDVLNAAERAQQQMKEKKRQEMLQKLQEEKERSRKFGPEKVPSEGVPGEHPHERKPGEGADLDVHVRQHRRHRPKRGK
jgi:hypothetical protein